MTTSRSDRTPGGAAGGGTGGDEGGVAGDADGEIADETPVDDALRSRLWSTADLSAARAETRRLLERGGVAGPVVVDVLLAFSELLTNALAAATPGTPVDAVVTVGPDPSESRFCGRRRRIDISVTNQGDPIPGRLVVSPFASAAASSPSGRGLPVAARVGEVVVEGIVGGTRASLKRSVIPAGRGDRLRAPR